MYALFPALLTAVCYSLSAILAARASKLLGAPFANLARMGLGVVFLGIWTLLWGVQIPMEARLWLWLSGIIGIGLGDIALFGSLERIGPRLTILLVQCLSAPVALIVEFLWLHTAISVEQLLSIVLILFGVGLALHPDQHLDLSRRAYFLGLMWGVGAAVGQGCGAVISRQAGKLAEFDGGSAALQRLLAGILCALVFYAVAGRLGISSLKLQKPPNLQGGAAWALGNAFVGPVLGIGCFQWALISAPAGIVLAIVATSPLLAMVWLWKLERQIPRPNAVIGGVSAVLGVIALHKF
jgi:drug/metabolite transporter (DMT)-like permease